jgi:hypothetical protein
MKYGETALLLAVRNVLRMPLDQGGAGFKTTECEIEYDEMAPGTVGDLYVAIMPGGWRPGPRHNTAFGVHDLVFGVDAVVIKRVGNVPRDRMRETFLLNLDSLSAEIDRITTAIDFTYLVNNTANALITAKTASTEGFIEPLKFTGVTPRPRPAPAELFGASGTQAGLMRTVSFHGARRVTTR